MNVEPRKLPPALQRFLAIISEEGASQVLENCFAQDAVVYEDGRQYEGVAAIRSWVSESRNKYKCVMQELEIEDEKVVMLAQLSGDFLGSPLEFDYTFRLCEDKIQSLEIA